MRTATTTGPPTPARPIDSTGNYSTGNYSTGNYSTGNYNTANDIKGMWRNWQTR